MNTDAKNENRQVYLDHAAATPVDPEVIKAMQPYWREHYGNASALYSEGRIARDAIEQARETIANAMHATPQEIIFTSGGTEANNLALFGAVGVCPVDAPHIVTSVIEHPSVTRCMQTLEERGGHVNYIGVDAEGILDLAALERVLTSETQLVSVMFLNNEIGTVQPIQKMARLVRKKAPHALLHTDASQAPSFFALNVQSLGVDLLTVDAQKMYGPKGIGALYVRRGVELAPILYGGKQEQGLRPGTENTASIVGFGKAFERTEARRNEDVEHITALRDYFIHEVETRIPDAALNGSRTHRSPNNVNFSFPNVEGEFLVVQLDGVGVACAARSACFGAGGEGSLVVRALEKTRATNAIRFTLGRDTTRDDIVYTIEKLVQFVEQNVL